MTREASAKRSLTSKDRHGGTARGPLHCSRSPWHCNQVTYDQVISDIVKVVEAIGASIMVVGGLLAFIDWGLHASAAESC